jgi:hypothetical protein
MVDTIFADELQAAVAVCLVDSHDAFRQRHAQPIFFLVGDLHIGADFLMRDRNAISLS